MSKKIENHNKKKTYINYEYLQTIGMLRINFTNLKDKSIDNFFYSIYGNRGYAIKGGLDISNLLLNDSIPNLFIKVNGNTIFFIKLKFQIGDNNIEEHKFINILSLVKKENINMNILDKSLEDNFKSINLEKFGDSEESDIEEEDEEEEESDSEESTPESDIDLEKAYNEVEEEDPDDNNSLALSINEIIERTISSN